MDHLQFELTRGWFIEGAESIPRGIASVKPEGFSNTIRPCTYGL
ncbi:hypothetical protein SAMN04488072_11771 [Lentibacillus halodurans]|uniref:Uncharacterized protein n=1 Tax=Lentibacillus halodurans TaxID=237679 RepID=A0A1I1A926_9BACI|nr:hypothetical protein [Lentibacillus halodurans]SFB34461.1 hypothetical protein SAMN04488072_11771 [Lentibacillus halodurans]